MMINSFNAPPRPSTSPVPNFFTSQSAPSFATGRAAKAPTGAPRPSGVAGPSTVQQAAAMQQAAVRLRPLPPPGRQSAVGGGGAFGLMMMIEGKTTGEEIERNAVDNRTDVVSTAVTRTASQVTQPQARAASRGGGANDEELDRLRQRMKKMEADLKKANDHSKRRGSEANEALQRISDLTRDLERQKECTARAEREAASAVLAKNEALAAGAADVAKLKKELDEAEQRLKQQLDLTAQAAAARADSDAKGWAADKALLQRGISDAQDDAANQRKRADLLQSQMDALRDAIAVANRKAEDEKAARAKSDAAHQRVIEELRSEADAAKAALAQWKDRIQLCDAFVLDVCQPHFTVVKDDKLTPMDANASSDQQGFVLVPLHLLLRGYGLLPGDKKKSIAEKYEKTRTA